LKLLSRIELLPIIMLQPYEEPILLEPPDMNLTGHLLVGISDEINQSVHVFQLYISICFYDNSAVVTEVQV